MEFAQHAWLVVCTLVGVLPFLFFARHYDRFVRAAYRQDRDFWRRIGEPRGFFWVPREKLLSFFAHGGANDIPSVEAEAKALFGGRDELWFLYARSRELKRRAFLFGIVSMILVLGSMGIAELLKK